MALFNKDSLMSRVKQATEKAAEYSKKAADTVSSAVKEGTDSIKHHQSDAKSLKAPVEGAIARYGVVYQGGLTKFPKAKSGEIGFNIMPDRFVLKSTIGTKDWFEDFEISYSDIRAFRIVKRQAGTWEMVFSSPDANVKDTETENVLEITYMDNDIEVVLRLEMLTGIHVYAQAKKCQELLDILRQHKILNQLNKADSTVAQPILSPADELKKYKELLDAGALTQEEFDVKKKQLLGI